MADSKSGGGRMVGLMLAAIIVVGLATVFYANRDAIFKGSEAGLDRFAAGSLEKLEIADDPRPAPTLVFRAPDGSETTLAAFRGKVAVVNVWAMWCAPCRTEMPTLAGLAGQVDPDRVAVVVVNVDGDDAQETPARAFLARHAPLAFYRDASFRLPFTLPGAGAMPQTVVLDRQGRIRASLKGAADWSSPEALALIRALVDEPA